MEHIFMGTVLLLIAGSLILGAILTAPKLERMGIRHSARHSFTIVCVGIGAYLGWISIVFFKDELGPENYVPELYVLRIGVMLACFHFLWAVWRCDK